MTDDLIARCTLLVDYCLRVEPGETDPDRLRAEQRGRWWRRAFARSSGRGQPDRPGRAAGPGRILPRERARRISSRISRPSRSAKPRSATAGSGLRRDRHPIDADVDPKRQAMVDRSASRPGAGRPETVGPDLQTDGRLCRRREDGSRGLRGLRRLGDVPRPRRPGRGLAGARASTGGPGGVHDGRQGGPIEADGTDLDAFLSTAGPGSIPMADATCPRAIFTGPVEDKRPGQAPMQLPGLPAGRESSASPWSSRAERSSRPGPTREKITSSRCSTSIPVPVAWASSGSA